WVRTSPVPRRAGGPEIQYIVVDYIAALVWLGNLAALELHPFLHNAPNLNRPLAIVFDLDPGEGTTILECARVAQLLREMLDDLGLQCFPKVSGSKGIQVYVPLNKSETYETTQPFAHALAQLLESRHRDLVISEMPKHLRTGKVFIDWSQNSDFKTTISVYSLRAKQDLPHVSVPVEWGELAAALKAKNPEALFWSPKDAIARFEQKGDLFAAVLTLQQDLPEVGQQSAAPPESLSRYEQKRNFSKTPEPAPKSPRRSHQGSRRRFVIQKHAASHLHYDFRLEMHDVLKSWAVPKGPPYTLDEKRLAMPTEDHPLDYLEFEGIIPKGQYGGGTVMVWDIGTYELVEGNYYKGFLKIYLDGKKLKGEWTLLRSREKDREVWFLSKTGRPMRALSKKREDASALSGRSMQEIAAKPSATWQSNRETEHLPDAKLEFVEPMLAKLTSDLPEGEGWMYEIKLDGYRTLVMKEDQKVTLFSRRGNILNGRFPAIAEAFGPLADHTVLDGEVIAMDEEGRPSFNLLQNARGPDLQLFFYAFDVLALQGKDTRALPLQERRRLLEESALAGLSDPVRLSASFDTDPAALVGAARQQGLEGLIAKRIDSRYESGERSGAWLKYKTNQGQELVIGGYLPGKQVFESLLVGYHVKPGGDLIFIAKIRNGFTPSLRREVAERFHGLETSECPFANLPEPKSARRGEALTKEVM
ncbi:MAG: hypothetical protein JO022_21635, partial [Acidobacteriaceae bacterium]|nr:hypothetical protein [Acidobacteriaceae bacterium]